MNDDVLLTVWCLTYNHIKYVRQALEGIVNQKTNFKYNIYIFDDASTDGTSDEVREFASRYDNITAIIPKHNCYGKKYRRRYRRWLDEHFLVGKYIAWCELDDLWIDNNKLQIQVDYMEAHPEYSLTVHNAIRLNEQTGELNMLNCYGDEDREVSANELIARKNGNVASCSMVFRRDAWFWERKSFFEKCGIGDIPRQLNAILHGKIYYFSRVMSVYHYRAPGAWTNKMANEGYNWIDHCLRMIRFYSQYDILTDGKYKKGCYAGIQKYYSWAFSKIRDMDLLSVEQHYDMHPAKQIIELAIISAELIADDAYISVELEDYCNNHRNIFIYGTGEYGTVIAKKLIEKRIRFEGFIQTHKKKDEYLGYKVYSIEDISNTSDVGCIIGIGGSYWYDIDEVLKKQCFSSIIAPFWLDMDIKSIHSLFI